MLSAECLQNNWLYLHGIILNCFQVSQKYMLFDTSKILEEILNKFELKKCLGPICADRHCTCLTFWLKQRLGLLALKSCISFNLISLHINTKLSCQQNQHSFQIMQNAWPAYSSPHSLCKVEVQVLKLKKKKKKKKSTWIYALPPHLKKKKAHLLQAISYFDSPYNTGKNYIWSMLKMRLYKHCRWVLSTGFKGCKRNRAEQSKKCQKWQETFFWRVSLSLFKSFIFQVAFMGRKKSQKQPNVHPYRYQTFSSKFSWQSKGWTTCTQSSNLLRHHLFHFKSAPMCVTH